MGIFGRGDKVDGGSASDASVIANGTKITGQFAVENRLFVEGEVNGKIDSSNTVSIGKNGKITGEVSAEKLIVSGSMFGLADVNSCEILTGGHLNGEIYSSSLVIEAGGILEGTSYVKQNKKNEKMIAQENRQELPKFEEKEKVEKE